MNTVLVTGVSGFIGSHIALQLLQRGDKVVGTVRSSKIHTSNEIINQFAKYTEKFKKLSIIGIDLDSPLEEWNKALSNVDYVIHVASPFPSIQPKNDHDIVAQAKNSILAILKATSTTKNVKKVVLTSSSGAVIYGNNIKNGVFDESNWTDTTNLTDTTPYYRSKTIAERSAFEYLQEHDSKLAFTSVLPGFVIGPLLFPQLNVSTGVIKSILNNEFPALPAVGFSSVDVRSVADLHIKALYSDNTNGKRLCASERFLSFKDISLILKEKYPERKITTQEFPDLLTRSLAIFTPALKPILLDLGKKREMRSQLPKNLLDWEPIPTSQSIIDCAQSLFELEIIKGNV